MSTASAQVPFRERKLHAKEQEKPAPGRRGYGRNMKFANREPVPDLKFPATTQEAIKQMNGMIMFFSEEFVDKAYKCHLTRDDIVHFGRLGVLEAYARFDPSKQIQFSTYCGWWIRAKMRRNVEREKKNMLSFSAESIYKDCLAAYYTYKEKGDPSRLTSNARKTYDELKSGRRSAEKTEKWLFRRELDLTNANEPISLEEPLCPDSDLCLNDVVKSPTGVNETAYDFEILEERILHHLKSVISARWGSPEEETMGERARVIFTKRTMLDEDTGALKLSELAELFNITKERVRQLELILLQDIIPKLNADPVVREYLDYYSINADPLVRKIKNNHRFKSIRA